MGTKEPSNQTKAERQKVCSTHSTLLGPTIRLNVGNRARRASAMQRLRSLGALKRRGFEGALSESTGH
jgi:hypothetical protein